MSQTTILMPARNAELTIRTSVRSALIQMGRNDKLFVYDDCSHDATNSVVKSIDDPRISLFAGSDGAIGVAGGLNYLLERVESEYVARLDADDLFVPGHLRAARFWLRFKDLDVVGAQMIAFPLLRFKFFPVFKSSFDKSILTRNPIAHPTVFGKASIFKKFRYRNIGLVEDFDLWNRLYLAGCSIGNSPHFATFYRCHSSQQTKDPLIHDATKKILEEYRSQHVQFRT